MLSEEFLCETNWSDCEQKKPQKTLKMTLLYKFLLFIPKELLQTKDYNHQTFDYIYLKRAAHTSRHKVNSKQINAN